MNDASLLFCQNDLSYFFVRFYWINIIIIGFYWFFFLFFFQNKHQKIYWFFFVILVDWGELGIIINFIDCKSNMRWSKYEMKQSWNKLYDNISYIYRLQSTKKVWVLNWISINKIEAIFLMDHEISISCIGNYYSLIARDWVLNNFVRWWCFNLKVMMCQWFLRRERREKVGYRGNCSRACTKNA